jgi:hypothetical protein
MAVLDLADLGKLDLAPGRFAGGAFRSLPGRGDARGDLFADCDRRAVGRHPKRASLRTGPRGGVCAGREATGENRCRPAHTCETLAPGKGSTSYPPSADIRTGREQRSITVDPIDQPYDVRKDSSSPANITVARDTPNLAGKSYDFFGAPVLVVDTQNQSRS